MGGLCGRFVKMVAEFLADLAEVWFASRFFRESRVQRLGTCWDMLGHARAREESDGFAMFRHVSPDVVDFGRSMSAFSWTLWRDRCRLLILRDV